MAIKRCFPTNLFFQRKFVKLSNDTTRVVLFGLVLNADDAGRGLADAELLGRQLNHAPEQIHPALNELEQAGFIQCYTESEEAYYSLCDWHDWQKLSKPTPSRYPAPPQTATEKGFQESPGEPWESLGNPGAAEASRPEGEEKGREQEKEGEEKQPASNVLAFPTSVTSSAAAKRELSFHEVKQLTQEVARILRIKPNAEVERIVRDYGTQPALFLMGEADAAREWIDDGQRNRQRQRMTPAFFRRWLKRELEAIERRQAAPVVAHAVGIAEQLEPTSAPPVGRRLPNLMHLADEALRGEKHS